MCRHPRIRGGFEALCIREQQILQFPSSKSSADCDCFRLVIIISVVTTLSLSFERLTTPDGVLDEVLLKMDNGEFWKKILQVFHLKTNYIFRLNFYLVLREPLGDPSARVFEVFLKAVSQF